MTKVTSVKSQKTERGPLAKAGLNPIPVRQRMRGGTMLAAAVCMAAVGCAAEVGGEPGVGDESRAHTSEFAGLSEGPLQATSLPALNLYVYSGKRANSRFFQRDVLGLPWHSGAPIPLVVGMINQRGQALTVEFEVELCRGAQCEDSDALELELGPHETWSPSDAGGNGLLAQHLMASPPGSLGMQPGSYSFRAVVTYTGRGGSPVILERSIQFDVIDPAGAVVLQRPEKGEHLMGINLVGEVAKQKVAFEWYDPSACYGPGNPAYRSYVMRASGPGSAVLSDNVIPAEDIEFLANCKRRYAPEGEYAIAINGRYRWTIGRQGQAGSFAQLRHFRLEANAMQIQEGLTHVSGARLSQLEIPVPFVLWQEQGVDYVTGYEAVRVRMKDPAIEPLLNHQFVSENVADLPSGKWLHLGGGNMADVASVHWQRHVQLADPTSDIQNEFPYYADGPESYQVAVPRKSQLPAELVALTEEDAEAFYRLPDHVKAELDDWCPSGCTIREVMQLIDDRASSLGYAGPQYLDVVLQRTGAHMSSFNRWVNTVAELFEMDALFGCYHASRLKVAMARYLGIPAIEAMLASAHGSVTLWLPYQQKPGAYSLADGEWVPFVANELIDPSVENLYFGLKTSGWTGSKRTRQHAHWNPGSYVNYEWNGAIDRTGFADDDLALLITWPILPQHYDAFLESPNPTDHMFKIDQRLHVATVRTEDGGLSLLLVPTNIPGQALIDQSTAVPLQLGQQTTIDLSEHGGTRTVTFVARQDPTLGSRYVVLEML